MSRFINNAHSNGCRSKNPSTWNADEKCLWQSNVHAHIWFCVSIRCACVWVCDNIKAPWTSLNVYSLRPNHTTHNKIILFSIASVSNCLFIALTIPEHFIVHIRREWEIISWITTNITYTDDSSIPYSLLIRKPPETDRHRRYAHHYRVISLPSHDVSSSGHFE